MSMAQTSPNLLSKRTCCTLRSPSVCLRTCESGLKGTAHSAPETSPWSDISNDEEVDEQKEERCRQVPLGAGLEQPLPKHVNP